MGKKKSEKSKTVIELQSGAITNDIRNKLSEGSSCEVNTPNSTMSVRGTMFRVVVYEVKDSITITGYNSELKKPGMQENSTISNEFCRLILAVAFSKKVVYTKKVKLILCKPKH